MVDNDSKYNKQKGWTYSFVYSLREIRDVYVLLTNSPGIALSDIVIKTKSHIISDGKTWNKRRVQEILNALVNFNVIDNKNRIVEDKLFTSELNSELSEEDKIVFNKIYLSYCRFVEFIILFLKVDTLLNNYDRINIEELKNNSHAIFSYSEQGKFTDTFLTKEVTISVKSNKLATRFWDVFIKWGKTLNLLEKILLPKSYSTTYLPKASKGISAVFFLSKAGIISVTIEDLVKLGFTKRHIHAPELVISISLHYRISIDDAKASVINLISNNRNIITPQRTTEIFIEENHKRFFPLLNQAFISHLLIKK